MSPEGGGPIKKRTGEGNPWRDTPEKDTHGEKKVKVKVTWGEEYCKAEKEKKYKLFFVKTGDDYPGSPGPNWFSYWSSHDDSAVTTKGFSHVSATNSRYGGRAEGSYGETNTATGVTTIFDTASEAKVKNYPACGININTKGIHTLAHTIGHERAHIDIVRNWNGGIWQGKADSDCDGIPNDVETSLRNEGYGCFDPNSADSTGGNYTWSAAASNNPWGRDGTPGGGDDGTCAGVISVDKELYCDVMGLKTQASNKNNDWANPGKQSKPAFERLIVEDGTSAALTGKFAEYGKDTDGNGLFNFLT